MGSRVFPSKSIAPLLTEYFVCVKVNVDRPPGAAEKLFEKANGNTLPLILFTTPDGAFISNTSGFRDENTFKADLERVLTHPSLRLSDEQEKKLAASADQAEKNLGAKEFGPVIRAWKESLYVKGFSDSKWKLKDLAERAVAAGRELLQDADSLVKADKQADAVTLLKKLQTDFRGTELEAPVRAALDAIEAVKPSSAPSPDTVILKDGTKVSGKIVARSEQLIMIQVPGGKFVKIEKEKIAEIQSEAKK